MFWAALLPFLSLRRLIRLLLRFLPLPVLVSFLMNVLGVFLSHLVQVGVSPLCFDCTDLAMLTKERIFSSSFSTSARNA
jgi:hypothetical protein